MQSAVFLDRDNTLILNDGDLGAAEEVRLIEGIPAGLRELRDAGFRLIVVTNQSGVARGVFTEEDVDAVHQRIALQVDSQAQCDGLIDRFYYCPYHPEATIEEYRREHPWRKPNPGMIMQAARDLGIDLVSSWMIGDQERDVQAGKAAGCRTILVTRDAELAQRARPTEVFATFEQAVAHITRQSRAATPPAAENPTSNGLAMPRAARGPISPGNGRDTIEIGKEASGIRRAIAELTDELRSDRLRRGEFTFITMLAGVCQLLTITLALLGLLQLGQTDVFVKWMLGAALAQLLTLTLLVLDLKS